MYNPLKREFSFVWLLASCFILMFFPSIYLSSLLFVSDDDEHAPSDCSLSVDRPEPVTTYSCASEGE